MSRLVETVKLLVRAKGGFYGWRLVGVSSVIMIMSNVPLFYGMAAWFPVLESRFAWSRAQLSLAFSLSRVEGSVTGIFGGYLIERVGARRMVLIGLLVVGAGFLILGQIQNLWQFYLAFIIASTGAGLGTWLAVMTVLNSWFVRRRATAMSLAVAGAASGAILLVPALAWSIDPDQFGPDRWRPVATGIGALILVLALPVSLLVRNRPEDYGQRPDGDPEPPGPPGDAPVAARLPSPGEGGATWRQAIRTRPFWLIALGHGPAAGANVTVMVHLGSMLNIDRGMSLQTVGLVVSTYMAISIVFNLVGGYIGDRVPIRLAIFGFSLVQSVAIAVLLLAHTIPMAFLFALLMGIGFGGRNPLMAAVRGVYFGRTSFASILGISMVPSNVAALAMPLFAGVMFDITKSYDVPFITIALVSFAASCCFLFLGEPRPFVPSPRATTTGVALG